MPMLSPIYQIAYFEGDNAYISRMFDNEEDQERAYGDGYGMFSVPKSMVRGNARDQVRLNEEGMFVTVPSSGSTITGVARSTEKGQLKPPDRSPRMPTYNDRNVYKEQPDVPWNERDWTPQYRKPARGSINTAPKFQFMEWVERAKRGELSR